MYITNGKIIRYEYALKLGQLFGLIFQGVNRTKSQRVSELEMSVIEFFLK